MPSNASAAPDSDADPAFAGVHSSVALSSRQRALHTSRAATLACGNGRDLRSPVSMCTITLSAEAT
jgi:hypothetical protein